MDFKHIYTTKRVAEEIPVHVQMFMIAMLDARQRQGEVLDYLQSFELSEDAEGNQVIINRQEVPQYEDRKVALKHPNYKTITTKLYVIDDMKMVTIMHHHDR